MASHEVGHTQRFLRLDMTEDFPSITQVGKTFLRSLIVPSLVEELLWRIALQPPGSSISYMVGINFAFAVYHIFGSVFLAEQLDNRQGARTVFQDPSFLSISFILGNACTWAYVRSAYSLWAPVLTHAIPVTVWLSFLRGDEALSTPGGLRG
jgi:predicted Abi (CAAX) family protease